MNAARFEGGPYDGKTLGMSVWPPPTEVPSDDEGHYVLVSQSQLPDELANHPNLMRGCIYRWESGT